MRRLIAAIRQTDARAGRLPAFCLGIQGPGRPPLPPNFVTLSGANG